MLNIFVVVFFLSSINVFFSLLLISILSISYSEVFYTVLTAQCSMGLYQMLKIITLGNRDLIEHMYTKYLISIKSLQVIEEFLLLLLYKIRSKFPSKLAFFSG